MTVDLMRVVQSGPAYELCRDYYYYLNTGEVTTEPHKSPMYSHESLKVHFFEHMSSDFRCQKEVMTTRNC